LDALTQLIEPFVSVRANPMTDLYAREGMRLAARSLARAYEDGSDRAAREEMSLASLYGGICLANAGLGAVHGFAAPVGGADSGKHDGGAGRTLMSPGRSNRPDRRVRRWPGGQGARAPD
jgi:alcohol dehydrogenase class IV